MAILDLSVHVMILLARECIPLHMAPIDQLNTFGDTKGGLDAGGANLGSVESTGITVDHILGLQVFTGSFGI